MKVTGEPLVRRSDDNVDALKKRLDAYHKQTKPLVDYYAKQGVHYAVNAAKESGDVFKEIEAIIKKTSAQREQRAQARL